MASSHFLRCNQFLPTSRNSLGSKHLRQARPNGSCNFDSRGYSVFSLQDKCFLENNQQKGRWVSCSGDKSKEKFERPAFEVLPSLKRLKKQIIAANRGDYDAVFMPEMCIHWKTFDKNWFVGLFYYSSGKPVVQRREPITSSSTYPYFKRLQLAKSKACHCVHKVKSRIGCPPNCLWFG
ncbi:hypothetical protein L6164_031340 [Bauhinia variegata]|uniref:Uncharacterized protein n=1 Tax=Bauhinia variegata TaxID=167791 RepID=A0ACB9LEN4_BAUVA|nr:hypothetical protein L6164_031340 [Bauhinia variegata]